MISLFARIFALFFVSIACQIAIFAQDVRQSADKKLQAIVAEVRKELPYDCGDGIYMSALNIAPEKLNMFLAFEPEYSAETDIFVLHNLVGDEPIKQFIIPSLMSDDMSDSLLSLCFQSRRDFVVCARERGTKRAFDVSISRSDYERHKSTGNIETMLTALCFTINNSTPTEWGQDMRTTGAQLTDERMVVKMEVRIGESVSASDIKDLFAKDADARQHLSSQFSTMVAEEVFLLNVYQMCRKTHRAFFYEISEFGGKRKTEVEIVLPDDIAN